MNQIKFLLLGLQIWGITGISQPALAHAEKPKLGFLLATLQEERYQKDKKYFNDESERLGFDTVFSSAENSEQAETTRLEELIALHVRAIVIQPVNSQAAGNLVNIAHQANIPVIAYDRIISNSPVDFYVTTDSYAVGRLQAEEAIQATHARGNYVILMGEEGQSVASEITRGVLSVLDKYPAVKIVVKKSHEGWSASAAQATLENALNQYQNHIDAVLANNSGMATGAVEVLKTHGLAGKVFVAGADADLAAIRNIAEGNQQFEVLKGIAPLARSAAQVAVALAKGKKPTPSRMVDNGRFRVPTMETQVFGITKSNLEERIFKTGFHTRASVYGSAKP